MSEVVDLEEAQDVVQIEIVVRGKAVEMVNVLLAALRLPAAVRIEIASKASVVRMVNAPPVALRRLDVVQIEIVSKDKAVEMASVPRVVRVHNLPQLAAVILIVPMGPSVSLSWGAKCVCLKGLEKPVNQTMTVHLD